MGFKERIKAVEKQRIQEERDRQQRIENAIANHPDRVKCQKIIPVIEPLIRELAKATKLHVERKYSSPNSSFGTHPLVVYTFWTRKKGIFSPMYSGHAFSVYLGAVRAQEQYPSGVKVEVYPLQGWSYTGYRHISDYYPKLDFTTIPEEPKQMKEVLSTFLFNLYQHAKSYGNTKY